MPRVTANGVSLHYEERGSGAPILCIHGTGSSAAIWGAATATLATHGRAIAYDRRGCHRSERPEPYVTSVRQHADDAAALLDALAAKPAVVVGRSYGADVAIDLARGHPDRVRALVLLEGGESLTEEGRRWLAGLGDQVVAAADADVNTVAETLFRQALGDATWEGLSEPVTRLFTANGPAIAAEFRGGFLEAGPDEIRAISHPTLLVAAESSPPVFARAIDLLAATMPSAQVARVGGGHLIDPAHPAVLAFIDEVLAA